MQLGFALLPFRPVVGGKGIGAVVFDVQVLIASFNGFLRGLFLAIIGCQLLTLTISSNLPFVRGRDKSLKAVVL